MNTGTAEGQFHRDITSVVIGVFYQVYNELGPGFLEAVYEASMAIALEHAGIRVQRQKGVKVLFRDHVVGDYRLDLLVEGVVAVELKAAASLDRAHESQLLNYLRATQLEVGLLLNFGPRPRVRRFLYTNDRKQGLTRSEPDVQEM